MQKLNKLLSRFLLLSSLVSLLGGPVFAAPAGQGYEFSGNGKRQFACLSQLYTAAQLDDMPLLLTDQKSALQLALLRQRSVLTHAKPWQSEGLNMTSAQLLQVAETVAQLPDQTSLGALSRQLTPYLLKGEDGCGNTHFTAYFAPLIQVKSKPDAQFKYPVYRKPAKWPQGKVPSRADIDQQGALQGLGLEIGYAASLLDIYMLQVQGSGLAHFLDTGEKITFQFGGQNGLPYSSLGRLLVDKGHVPADQISLNAIRDFFAKQPELMPEYLSRNASYTFFDKVKAGPKGTLSTEVVPEISIAVDPAFIPLGSVLLAEIPRLNAQGEFIGHAYRLLVAQDTGGAIKGPGHVDMFMGIGPEAQAKAGFLHHYGRLWLLLPKQ
ncbi:MAG: murein transglycosylase A [Candidatus Sericytochromatia bacterium]|nr:murein transglycosylase A [Candidatus Sericytochromatia bacterium]